MTFPSQHKKNSETSAGFLFMKAYTLWHAQIKTRLSAHGITHPQFVFLACTGYLKQFNEHVTQKMISELSDIDAMTTSQIAKLLEKKGLIHRNDHPSDTRAKSITITPLGQSVLENTLPLVENIDNAFFGKLKEDTTTFIHLLQILAG